MLDRFGQGRPVLRLRQDVNRPVRGSGELLPLHLRWKIICRINWIVDMGGQHAPDYSNQGISITGISRQTIC
ncbi:hypothetical protein SAMN04488057_12424 [Cyclobacterium lianum]|uniref:Uncharacterized protein n=1 Tax=Cyclobacterium lianum TaxID=388280 RepID=A0A1M7QTN8_9BACT|nr:hypothetical protein SAMN04488057_12424 [Cyclobacterium lianum]